MESRNLSCNLNSSAEITTDSSTPTISKKNQYQQLCNSQKLNSTTLLSSKNKTIGITGPLLTLKRSEMYKNLNFISQKSSNPQTGSSQVSDFLKSMIKNKDLCIIELSMNNYCINSLLSPSRKKKSTQNTESTTLPSMPMSKLDS